MPNYDLTIVHPSNMHRVGHCLRWLHQFTLLPRSPDGANLLLSVSPHIEPEESYGFEDVQREHLEDRWLIALDGLMLAEEY